MNTVDGYAISSWERGLRRHGVRARLGDHPAAPPPARDRPGAVRPGLARPLARSWSRRARSSRRSSTRFAERGLVALAGTELEFIAFNTTYEDAGRLRYRDLEPVNQYNVDYSDPRHHPRRAAAARHPQHDVRRGPGRRGRQGRVQLRAARDRLPVRRRAGHARTTTASTRPSPRRSRPSAARRSRSWRSTTSARAAPATSTSPCGERTETVVFWEGGELRTRRAVGDVRQLRGRPPRHDARLHAALRAERQLLQAVRRRLVRADGDRLGRGQPHLRRTPGRPRPERPDGEPRCPVAT